MSKKEKTKEEKPKEKEQPQPVQAPNTEQQDDEKPFDFGGLPDRDLKKNLGCG